MAKGQIRTNKEEKKKKSVDKKDKTPKYLRGSDGPIGKSMLGEHKK